MKGQKDEPGVLVRARYIQPMIDWNDFEKVDIRVGTITAIDAFPKARHPAWKLTIDFGADIGLKRTSAQIVELYDETSLKGRQVLAVVNFPPKQIADFMSEVLVLGLVGDPRGVVLLSTERTVTNGLRVG